MHSRHEPASVMDFGNATQHDTHALASPRSASVQVLRGLGPTSVMDFGLKNAEEQK